MLVPAYAIGISVICRGRRDYFETVSAFIDHLYLLLIDVCCKSLAFIRLKVGPVARESTKNKKQCMHTLCAQEH